MAESPRLVYWHLMSEEDAWKIIFNNLSFLWLNQVLKKDDDFLNSFFILLIFTHLI